MPRVASSAKTKPNKPTLEERKHQGKPHETGPLFADIAKALSGTHEVLVTGPGSARDEFRAWCHTHQATVGHTIVDSIASDHPSDAQVVALARQYFQKFDQTTADPSKA